MTLVLLASSNRTTSSPYGGTTRYKAPELFKSRRNPHPECTFSGDMFGLGGVALVVCQSKTSRCCLVTIFQFGVLKEPYNDYDNEWEIMDAIRQEEKPANWTQIKAELEKEEVDQQFITNYWTFLKQCWSHAPNSRPIREELIHALKPLAGNLGMSTRNLSFFSSP